MEKCKIFAVANQKGGTAKSTTAFNLGVALSKMGKRVLLVDFDPQANLSMCFGIERPEELEMSMNEILTLVMDGVPLPDKTSYIRTGDNLDIIPISRIK